MAVPLFDCPSEKNFLLIIFFASELGFTLSVTLSVASDASCCKTLVVLSLSFGNAALTLSGQTDALASGIGTAGVTLSGRMVVMTPPYWG